jgi:hypothetical protein
MMYYSQLRIYFPYGRQWKFRIIITINIFNGMAQRYCHFVILRITNTNISLRSIGFVTMFVRIKKLRQSLFTCPSQRDFCFVICFIVILEEVLLTELYFTYTTSVNRA